MGRQKWSYKSSNSHIVTVLITLLTLNLQVRLHVPI